MADWLTRIIMARDPGRKKYRYSMHNMGFMRMQAATNHTTTGPHHQVFSIPEMQPFPTQGEGGCPPSAFSF